MFTSPMWYDEIQRLGYKKCSFLAYNLLGVSDALGALSFLLLLASIFRAIVDSLANTRFLLIAFAVFFILRFVFFFCSSWIVAKHQFNYDYEKRLCTWSKEEVTCTYDYSDYEKENKER